MDIVGIYKTDASKYEQDRGNYKNCDKTVFRQQGVCSRASYVDASIPWHNASNNFRASSAPYSPPIIATTSERNLAPIFGACNHDGIYT